MKMLPRVVYQMCVHGAYIAGSYAMFLANPDLEIVPGDYDLIVPPAKWSIIGALIPPNATVNNFGGVRFTTEDHEHNEVEVDVWPDYIENYLSRCKTKHNGNVCVVDFINNKVFESRYLAL